LWESIDTTGGGRLFHVFGALAQFEQQMVWDGRMAGLPAARAGGPDGDWPAKLSPDQVRAARRLYNQREHTVKQVGGMFRGQPHLYISGVA